MSLPAMLDVAIGIILLFLILGLIVTAINELIAKVFRLRAKGLRGGIERLVDDPNLMATLNATGMFHIGAASDSKVGPSYLSGRNFALAVVEAVESGGNVQDGLADITRTVNALPDGKFKQALVTLTRAAADDAEAKLQAIGAYFDEAMERASGVYKRWMQLSSLLIGLLLAVVMNADALHVGRALWTDQVLREQISESASQVVEVAAAEAGDPEALADIQSNLDVLRPFPIGWDATPLSFSWQSLADDWDVWIGKIIGLVLTGAAVTLGAPFWFDLLSRFTNIRSSGGLSAAAKRT